MRVLHVNKFLYRRGGAEGYMLDLADLQTAAGDEVAFYGTDHRVDPSLPTVGALTPYVELNPPPAGLTGRLAAATGMVWNRAAERGMAAAVAEFAPDVVHLHNIYHQLSPSILRPLRDSGTRVVMTLHDYKLACPTYQLMDNGTTCDACLGGHFLRAVPRRCRDGSLLTTTLMATESAIHTRLRSYAAVDALICPSRFMLDTMARAGVFPERLHHVPHPVAVPAQGKSHPGGDALFAGRLSPEKGCDVLIEAFGLLAAQGLPWRLTVAGDGPSRPELEAAAARLAPGAITFVGHVSKPALAELLDRAAVSVVPSRWHENQPLAVLESLAAGVPVIGTTLGGTPELIRDGLDGRLVPPNDPKALAAAIGAVMSAPQTAWEMGRQGRRRVIDNFDAAVHLAAISRLYLMDVSASQVPGAQPCASQ